MYQCVWQIAMYQQPKGWLSLKLRRNMNTGAWVQHQDAVASFAYTLGWQSWGNLPGHPISRALVDARCMNGHTLIALALAKTASSHDLISAGWGIRFSGAAPEHASRVVLWNEPGLTCLSGYLTARGEGSNHKTESVASGRTQTPRIQQTNTIRYQKNSPNSSKRSLSNWYPKWSSSRKEFKGFGEALRGKGLVHTPQNRALEKCDLTYVSQFGY